MGLSCASRSVAKDANILLGGNEESMLLLDETLKKGTHSVEARQYCGCSGKIENGQVAVLELSAVQMSPWSSLVFARELD